MKSIKLVVGLAAGNGFGIGLAGSGMNEPQKVLGLLDVYGDWDATVLIALATALILVMLMFYLAQYLSEPVFAAEFEPVEKQDLDKRLVIGALLFGIGWGLVGLCPGPALSSIFYFEPNIFIFIVMMVAGMFLAGKVAK